MSITGSLYFHLPFCRHKCPYCHFSVYPYDPTSEKILFEGLEQEWQQKKGLIDEVITLYFGGGTPSLVNPDSLAPIIARFPKAQEITIEANPEDVTVELVKRWKEIGINRVSLGVQTLDDELLHFLERRHGSKKAIDAIHSIAEGGIYNISIDLMFELPNQKLIQFRKTLAEIKNLPITHLSLYNLSYEVGSHYYKKRRELEMKQPPPEEGLKMLEEAVCLLEEIGLKRYEISAFAKDGYASLHNLGYWQYRPFLGLGPSAFSYFEGRRFRNQCHLLKWKKALDEGSSLLDFEEKLPPLDLERERLAIGLRMLQGIPSTFSKKLDPLLQLLKERGWIAQEKDLLKLTPSGLLFYDSVAEEII